MSMNRVQFQPGLSPPELQIPNPKFHRVSTVPANLKTSLAGT